jgi:hypothetical protein
MKKAVALACVLAMGFSTPVLARGGGGGGHSSGGSSHSSIYGGTGSNSSSHSMSGYTTRNGTYVAPHQQTNPNSTMRDNYGAQGNVNPYTGAVGTRRVPY